MVEVEKGRRVQAEVAIEELRRENGALRGECAALRVRIGQDEREREREREREGDGGEEELRRELEEEKALRISAERKLTDAMEKLRAVGFRFF